MPETVQAGGAQVLTPAELTEILAPDLDGATVVAVEATRVGTGQIGDTYRLALTVDRPCPAPGTVVAKVPSSDPVSRSAGVSTRCYEIETSFYRDLAPTLPVRAPRCHHVRFDPDTHDFVLLLEDLAPARQGDQLAGCSVDEAALAVEELPRLHAPRWGDSGLGALPWLARATPESTSLTAQLVTAVYPGFRDRFGSRLDLDVAALLERFVPRLPAYLAERPRPWTVAHGDYRLDNLLFTDGPAGVQSVAVVDWQTVAYGPGIADLAYFLGAGLLPDDRRAAEAELVRSYHSALTAAGVGGLSWDECWRQYRRFAFAGLIMAVVASMLVGQDDRGDEMFLVMANRHGRHALDLEAETLLP